ncbi:MAG: hypothetical protein AABX25_02475 [Nanoarchaeota archaeon]
MTIDDTIDHEEKNKRSSIWDSLVAAYSSSRAIKAGLAALNYSYSAAATQYLGFYAAARALGTSIKIASKIVTFRYNKLKQIYNDVKDTFSIRKVKRPLLIGGSLGTAASLGM